MNVSHWLVLVPEYSLPTARIIVLFYNGELGEESKCWGGGEFTIYTGQFRFLIELLRPLVIWWDKRVSYPDWVEDHLGNQYSPGRNPHPPIILVDMEERCRGLSKKIDDPKTRELVARAPGVSGQEGKRSGCSGRDDAESISGAFDRSGDGLGS